LITPSATGLPARGGRNMRNLREMLAQVARTMTPWRGGIEDRGSEETQDTEAPRRALAEAQERSERVDGIKREVRIIARKYDRL